MEDANAVTVLRFRFNECNLSGLDSMTRTRLVVASFLVAMVVVVVLVCEELLLCEFRVSRKTGAKVMVCVSSFKSGGCAIQQGYRLPPVLFFFTSHVDLYVERSLPSATLLRSVNIINTFSSRYDDDGGDVVVVGNDTIQFVADATNDTETRC